MKIEDLKISLETSVSKGTISTNMLIGNLKFMDTKSKKSSQYLATNYLPAYYHLSKFIKPKNVVQIGLDLGFSLCCFLKGSDSVEEILAFQHKDKNDDSFYSERLAISNIKEVKKNLNLSFYRGLIFDESFESLLRKNQWDCFFIHEKYGKFDTIKEEMDASWKYLKDDGFLVVDGIFHKKINQLFRDFCKIKNSQGIEIKTRYGLGIIRK